MADDADAVYLSWLRATLVNGLITKTEFGAGLLTLAAANGDSRAVASSTEHVASVQRDGEAALERLPPSLHALDYGALKN